MDKGTKMDNSPNDVWELAKSELEHQMNRATFNTWLKDATLVEATDESWTIGVKSAYARDWLTNRLYNTIEQTLNGIAGAVPALIFVVKSQNGAMSGGTSAADRGNTPSTAPSTMKGRGESNRKSESRKKPNHLNVRYTFSNFIVGHNNRLAHAAALAVSEKPGEGYNPLFIYGGVGLGKTHLLHAIGHRCREQGLTVCYISSETFTNDLVESIKTGKTPQFREKYRTPDVMLIDDIQFIAGKESTQEELFHTFNELHSNGKQLVLSSDRPPRAMVTLEERLKSRFEWGLMADIQLPDQETRLAILQYKAEESNIDVPVEVLQRIARHVRRNIRELEGALNKVVAYAELTDRPIDDDLVEMALADLMRKSDKVNMDQVVRLVAKYYGVSVEQLRGKGRTRSISYPRQVAMFLCRTETDCSFPQIGTYMGGRDHTTVMHGYEKIATKVDADEALRRDVLELKAALFELGAD